MSFPRDEGREVEGWAHYWAMIYDHVADVLESDAAIREAAMVLRYEDLCENPSTVFSRILAHCDLAPEELPKLAAQRIKHPSYYRPSFTQEEEAMIRRITAPSATLRLRSLRATCCSFLSS